MVGGTRGLEARAAEVHRDEDAPRQPCALLGRAANAPVEQVKLRRWTTARVAEILLSYAEGAEVDMIALGSMRHGRVERWILGTVTTDIARDGSRPMLVVPPDDRANA